MKREREEHDLSGTSQEQPAVMDITAPLEPASEVTLVEKPSGPPPEITLVEQPSGPASEATLIEKPNSPSSENTLVEPISPPAGSGSFGRQQPGPIGQPASSSSGDRFERRHKLGEGGQGEVWLAFDPKLDRYVALKEIKPGLHGSRDVVSGFRNEAKLTGELEHPNIVTVYEAEHMQESAGARPKGSAPFYVMRVFGNRNLMKAITEFYARERTAEAQALQTALSNVQTKPTAEHRQQLRAALEQFAFDEQHPSDARLREAIRSYLDDPQALDGRSLHDAVRELHSGTWSAESERTLRELLRRFIHICNAVAYAHSRGLIHRDLKPQNVMLGGYGETLVVDWGLAKVVGRDELHANGSEGTVSSVPGADETAMGSIKGTLAYMPPEQARGEITSLGPRSDIYSLGGILYALLTGQPPVTSRNPREILDAVKAGRFPKPTERNPHVPKPLEAVCLKALAKEPLDRYGTALDLAADVARWLDDEPVSAWPEPFTIRAKRWVKSHQTAVTSTAAAILMATVTLSVMFAVVTGQKAEIAKSLQRETEASQRERDAKLLAQNNERRAIAGEKEAKLQRDAATTARQLAEANAKVATEQSQLALSTLNSVIFDLQGSLKNVPGGATVRNRLLTKVLPQLDKVSTQFVQKSSVDRNTMAALIELADTILQLGSTDGSSAPHSAGCPPLPNGEADPNMQASRPLHDQSAVLTAERLYQRAHEIGKQLAAANPNDTKASRYLSGSFDRLGDVFVQLGRTADALTQYQAGMKIRRVLADADPDDVQKQRDLLVSFNKIGDVFLQLGRTDDALTQFQAYEKLCRVLADADPNDAQKQRDLWVSFVKFGDVFRDLGRTTDALTQFQDGLKISRVLAEADPNDTQKQRDLASSCVRLGDVFLMLGRTDDALTQIQDGLKIRRVLAEADPNDAQKQRDLAVSFERLGQISLSLGKTDDALRYFSDELVIAERR
ncbi:MAG: protein kinase domain-containing protein, partial [Planctomycetaceae bacterium]